MVITTEQCRKENRCIRCKHKLKKSESKYTSCKKCREHRQHLKLQIKIDEILGRLDRCQMKSKIYILRGVIEGIKND